MKLPIVCKFKHNYVYAGKLKEKDLYIVLLEFNSELGYYSAIFEKNGKPHGKNYTRWLSWTVEDIMKLIISMGDLPKKVSESVIEQITIYEEVNRRCYNKKPMISD